MHVLGTVVLILVSGGLCMSQDQADKTNNNIQTHDYCIIGAGPAGLQLGYFMERAGRDYIIYERNNVSGSFFAKYPRHRKLISINKISTGRTNHLYNERHDWNSLLSDDDSLLFKHYSKEFFPPTEPLLDYLEDYRKKLGIKVQFNTEVKNMRRVANGERTDGYNFIMNDQEGKTMLCKVAIVASGMQKSNMVSFKGSEYVENYSEFDTDPQKYWGKTILILGRGNSAFETADELYKVANFVHMVSRTRVKLSWNTHYVGDVRGLNNAIVDTYQLKSLDGLLEFDVNRLTLSKKNGRLYAAVNWGDKYNDTSLYPRVKPQSEDNFANFPFRSPYDHVISCLGWKFDGSFLHEDSQQIPFGKAPKYPAIRYDYQSWVTRDLYFAGTNSHSVDFRKAAGGFIHGFRYTARALHKILEYRYHGIPWPAKTFPVTQLLNMLVKRINEAPGTYQMVSFLGDVVILKGDTFLLLEEFPVKLLPHFLDITGQTGSKFLVIINEYGPGFSAPDVDTLGPYRAITGGAMEAHNSNFLHPVVYFYDGWLPSEEDFSALPTETWKFALPKPDKVHHVVEDFLSMWTASTVHILPIRRFLEDVLGQDMRLYFNSHCFELGLNFANVPAGCKAYLQGQGLDMTLGDAVNIVNYMQGTTEKLGTGLPKCHMEEDKLNHNAINRTELLQKRLNDVYKSQNSLFPHDFVSDEEEVEAFRFIYDDSVPESLLEDDEVRSLWRWSRSVIAHQAAEYPFVKLTEANYNKHVTEMAFGIVLFGVSFDPVSRTTEEYLSDLVAEYAQMSGTKKPLIAVVDCWDWTRICEKAMITEYPTIKLLKNGDFKPYTSQISKPALRTALKLIAMNFPVRLNSVAEVDKFLSDAHMVDVGVESAVVLSYPQLYSADRESFNFLDDLYGKVPVAICCNSSARHEEFYAKYGRSLGLMHSRKEPWAVIAHSADTYMDHMEKASVLPPKNAVASFLQDQTLPIFVS
ncbi:unnamed protein product [Notodromas monacha]|uniref:FAD-dependent oxidoreductase domain-containing protein 2 n=1 Tax=Notodromas monacha TaxID=399045 RepID=A0A7R9BJR9_9CRUS|nr:unnamed protein product [Notodromas monacha]CAG0916793.1 unnamed protein product [Notodromas monacha]